MNDDPAAGAPQGPGTPDALDDTQRVEIPRYVPAPDPRPDARWAWASPGEGDRDRWYGAASPEASAAGGHMAGGSWNPTPGAADAPPPPGWASGAASAGVVAPQSSVAAPVGTGRRSGPGAGTVLAAALLAAVLASGGTAIVLRETGALDREVIVPRTGTGQQVGSQLPVTIDESSAVIDAAAKVSPAVVKIMTADQSTDPFTDLPTEGVGSGVLFDSAGWILTNRHVITDVDALTVELRDGRRFAGRVYGIDTLTDLAIVKIDATGLPTAPVGRSDGLKVGQLVVAIGSPLGTYSFSVTSGIVSGKGRDIRVDDGTRINNLIQTDAAINPGNSGGPLVDAGGNVVGINTAVATDSSGIGFAIPIDIARPIMDQALAGVALSRPWIGIRFVTIDRLIKEEEQLPVENGALVSASGGTNPAVEAGSPGDRAGLREGDIILSIDGIVLDLEHPLDALLTQFAPNDTVVLKVLRDGAPIELQVTLGTRPDRL
jgi:S1-C subfamily serine protease